MVTLFRFTRGRAAGFQYNASLSSQSDIKAPPMANALALGSILRTAAPPVPYPLAYEDELVHSISIITAAAFLTEFSFLKKYNSSYYRVILADRAFSISSARTGSLSIISPIQPISAGIVSCLRYHPSHHSYVFSCIFCFASNRSSPA